MEKVLADANTELREIRSRIDALLLVKAGAEAYLGQVVGRPRIGLRGTTAVVAILRESGEPMTSHQLVAEMVSRGWIVDTGRAVDTVRTALQRGMRDHPELQRVGLGTYAWIAASCSLSPEEP